jgi:hypothetical protein
MSALIQVMLPPDAQSPPPPSRRASQRAVVAAKVALPPSYCLCCQAGRRRRRLRRVAAATLPLPLPPPVDGHAKLRTQEPSQPQGQPPATSPTRVSGVTWGPSQVIQIPQRILQRIPPRCPRDPTKNRQRIGGDTQQFRK